jgi:hypothetical protein
MLPTVGYYISPIIDFHVAFFYSQNPLNVVISRARCLAVIVASPKLLEAPCNTIEQMKLVNTLCFVKAYADGMA